MSQGNKQACVCSSGISLLLEFLFCWRAKPTQSPAGSCMTIYLYIYLVIILTCECIGMGLRSAFVELVNKWSKEIISYQAARSRRLKHGEREYARSQGAALLRPGLSIIVLAPLARDCLSSCPCAPRNRACPFFFSQHTHKRPFSSPSRHTMRKSGSGKGIPPRLARGAWIAPPATTAATASTSVPRATTPAAASARAPTASAAAHAPAARSARAARAAAPAASASAASKMPAPSSSATSATFAKKGNKKSAASASAARAPQCPICLEDLPTTATKSARLRSTGLASTGAKGCAHVFCKPCLATYCRLSIEGGKADGGTLPCPVKGCGHALTTNDMRGLVSAETYAKHRKFMFERKMAENKGHKYCPNPRCRIALDVQVKGRGAAETVVCPKCKQEFCLNCSLPPHPGKNCEAMLDTAYGKWKKTKGSLVKPCWNCGAKIEKHGGCNHMTCRCKAQMCFLHGVKYGTCTCYSGYVYPVGMAWMAVG